MSSASQHSADVVIVGGGIGGLSNALALARGGYRVRLLEQAPEFGEVGAGLQMAPNATRILRSWGLLDQVVERGVLPRRLVFRDALDGSDLTHLDLGKGFQERYDAPYVVIHRSDLHNILLEGCREAGVELLTSSHVDDVLMVGSDAVALVGGQEYRADVVLAADGLNSSLRPRFSADEPVPSGYAAYRGAIPVADLPSTEYVSMQDVVVYFGPGCHFVQYPLRRGEIFNQVAVFRSPAFLRGEENWGGPEELEAAFAHCAPQVRAGLSVLWTDRYWPMYDRNPITSWVQGRLALTGDAAHPMLQYLAQGACQAIEDAAALASHAGPRGAAGELLWDDALKAYQAERTVRTARVQTTARLWGDIWHCDGLTRTLRNAVFRDRPIDDYQYVDWLYSKEASASASAAHRQAEAPAVA